ncbi:MAG TPA: anti-sigma factor [Gaiellaceae bacterium]|nr:anti-sigma factor [Gaiellaceae bacterium]
MKPWIATCRETRGRLSDYLEGELDARGRTRIVRHLSRCKRCQAMLESVTRTLEQLRALGNVEQVEPAPATVRAVVERIRLEEP